MMSAVGAMQTAGHDQPHGRELTVYPGSFIWRRINDEWLLSRSASALFAMAGFVIVGMTVVIFANIQSATLDPVSNAALGVGGVLAGLGVLFLWGGMWRYWIRCDSSTVAARRFWFLVLVAGLWYGAILYYAIIYLPNRRSQVMQTGTLEK
jgi:hypothetical protein